MNILVVQREKKQAEYVAKGLKESGYIVEYTDNLEEAYHLCELISYDLAIVDTLISNKSGLDFCKNLREINKDMGVIFLSSDTDINIKVKAFECGGDDYITKPFNLKILLLKVKKLLKLDDNNIYKFENFSYDIKKGEITINGENSELTRREIQFLEYMIKNKGIIFSRDYLLNEIWGFDFEGDDRVVDTLVKRIRKKLGDYSFLLKTIRGMGYSFDENKN